ncbi:NAD(P)-dependent oxidoreductase [Arthrobacter castelli]|uniref:NAD(P)-dependent oxidoreductase n=1 Tax=Arthrobacter castelli TaxID=271431 RepID=UPI0004799825|nr:NAD(P)-dependent oxidoreductase [Arthrobacter castelli]
MTEIAVIGLGTMGGRVASKLTEAGRSVSGYDPVAGARDAAAAHGIQTHTEQAPAIADAELIVLSLPRPDDVIEAARGPLSHAQAGSVVVDLSTIDAASAKTASEHLVSYDVDYVDAPVLGRPEGCGHWTLPAGGAEGAIDTVAAFLEGVVAKRVVRVGDVGAGSVVKILNNLMFGAINAVTAEALNTCRLAGVDTDVFVNTVAESGAATVSNLFRELAPKLIANDYEPAFSLALLAKDNKLALDLEGAVGSPSFVAGSIDHINSLTMNQGYGRQDTGSVQELYRTLSRTADE